MTVVKYVPVNSTKKFIRLLMVTVANNFRKTKPCLRHFPAATLHHPRRRPFLDHLPKTATDSKFPVHQHRGQPPGRPEDVLLAQIDGGEEHGQEGLDQRRRRRRDRDDEELRQVFGDRRRQVHAEVHVRGEQGM